MWQRFFTGPAEWTTAFLAAVATLLIATLGAWLVRRLVIVGFSTVAGRKLDTRNVLISGPLRLLSGAVFLVIFELLLFPAFEFVDLEPRTPQRSLRPIVYWLLNSGVVVLLISVAAYALIRATALLAKRFEDEVIKGHKGDVVDALEMSKRACTLSSVIRKAVNVLILAVAGMMILKELGLDISPLLTGAGIVGLAVGFGGQTLVRDIISGFFLIMEDQIRVGDLASINGQSGIVEDLNIRTIVLRDLEGAVHIFPNGAIETLANHSKDFSYYVGDLNISYREDTDRVATILREVATELQSDSVYGPFMLESLEILGVNAFTERAITIRFRLKTVPLKQHAVGREFLRRLKKALDRNAVELRIADRIVTVQERPPETKPPD